MTRVVSLADFALSLALDAFREDLVDDVQARYGLPDKPRYGEPCNGCGECCLMVQCALSKNLFGAQPVCPAINLQQGRASCDLIVNPDRYVSAAVAPKFAEACGLSLGAGAGCDSVRSDEDDALCRLDDEARSARVDERGPRIEALFREVVNGNRGPGRV